MGNPWAEWDCAPRWAGGQGGMQPGSIRTITASPLAREKWWPLRADVALYLSSMLTSLDPSSKVTLPNRSIILQIHSSQCQSVFFGEHRRPSFRKASGVQPWTRLNTREKLLASLTPTFGASSLRGLLLSRRSVAARCIRLCTR